MKTAFLSMTVRQCSLIALVAASLFCTAAMAAGIDLDDLLSAVEKIQSRSEQDAEALRMIDQGAMFETAYVKHLSEKLERGANPNRIAVELAGVERRFDGLYVNLKNVRGSVNTSAEALARIEVQAAQRSSRELKVAITQAKSQISDLERSIDVCSDSIQSLHQDIDELWHKLAEMK